MARVVVVWAGFVALPLGACAQIELGAEAVKSAARAALSTDETASGPDSEQAVYTLAQASTQSDVALISSDLTEAPDLFDVAGPAVWDGKRTLQGIWAAHADATTVRRIRIIDIASGRAIDGALFRRQAAGDAPPVLISSDAAQRLGLQPGVAATLRLVALRPRSREPAPSRAAPSPETQAPTAAETLAPTAEPAQDPIGTAPAPVQDTAPVDPTDPTPDATVAAAAAAAEVTPSTAATPLPPIRPVTAVSEAEAAPTQDQSATSPLTASVPGLAFIQAGLFGVADNAKALASRIEAAGLPAVVEPVSAGARSYTRVVSGPYQSTVARDEALEQIRSMGVPDATPVRR